MSEAKTTKLHKGKRGETAKPFGPPPIDDPANDNASRDATTPVDIATEPPPGSANSREADPRDAEPGNAFSDRAGAKARAGDTSDLDVGEPLSLAEELAEEADSKYDDSEHDDIHEHYEAIKHGDIHIAELQR
ncbi:MAG TPA: hypothetical protein VGX78_09210, partial [Pirellulales bacterium]|nr:hypothetical protein [Pirellulales bacterium]